MTIYEPWNSIIFLNFKNAISDRPGVIMTIAYENRYVIHPLRPPLFSIDMIDRFDEWRF